MDLRKIAQKFLARQGWKTVGPLPDLDKFIMIAAPHTSNWDLLYMLAVGIAMDVRVNWIGKHTLFEGPFGGIFSKLGGLPVDRRSRNDAVKSIAAHFDNRDSLCLAISPEGTRSYTDHWKTGFYYIAKEANVPIVCGFLDYGRKKGGVKKVIWPITTLEDVMQQCHDVYTPMAGYRDTFGPVRVKPSKLEDDDAAGDASATVDDEASAQPRSMAGAEAS
jgi:1-acyl-sn-glycerol-3-phosphate acyltransferase